MKIGKKHIKVIEMLFEGDLTRSEIASELQIAESTLYNWLNNKDFVNVQKDYALKQLNKSSSNAVRKIVDLLEAESETVQLNAAKDILDRTGFKPKEEIEHSGGVDIRKQYAEMSDDELEELVKRYEKINDT